MTDRIKVIKNVKYKEKWSLKNVDMGIKLFYNYILIEIIA